MINEQPKTIAQVGQARVGRTLYEKHLLMDKVVGLASATPHERFEAFALSVRELLAQRWVDTESTYAHENPKRVYYLSMEFLIGDRSPTTSPIFSWMPMCSAPSKRSISIGWPPWSRSPTRDSAMAALGVWRPVFWIPWRQCRFPRWAMGSGTNTACSSRSSRMGGK